MNSDNETWSSPSAMSCQSPVASFSVKNELTTSMTTMRPKKSCERQEKEQYFDVPDDSVDSLGDEAGMGVNDEADDETDDSEQSNHDGCSVSMLSGDEHSILQPHVLETTHDDNEEREEEDTADFFTTGHELDSTKSHLPKRASSLSKVDQSHAWNRIKSLKIISSKYDFVKVRVYLSKTHYYVLSRFLVNRVLTATQVGCAFISFIFIFMFIFTCSCSCSCIYSLSLVSHRHTLWLFVMLLLVVVDQISSCYQDCIGFEKISCRSR